MLPCTVPLDSLVHIDFCFSFLNRYEFSFIFLQLKELEQENEDIRLRNLRRVRTEEKLHASSENCQENGDENSNEEKVGYQSIHCDNFLSWFGLEVVLHAHTDKIRFYWHIDYFFAVQEAVYIERCPGHQVLKLDGLVCSFILSTLHCFITSSYRLLTQP